MDDDRDDDGRDEQWEDLRRLATRHGELVEPGPRFALRLLRALQTVDEEEFYEAIGRPEQFLAFMAQVGQDFKEQRKELAAMGRYLAMKFDDPFFAESAEAVEKMRLPHEE